MIRNPTKDELSQSPTGDGDTLGFQPIAVEGGRRVRSPESQFRAEITKYEAEANKKGLPFASAAAVSEFQDKLDVWTKKWKRQGFATTKKPDTKEIDWAKYCDLKNFELIDEGEKYDPHLSKRYNIDVFVKKKKYKFKGYSNIYTIMESGLDAVKKAKK